MRRLTSLKYHAVRFMLSYIFLQALVSLTLGSFDTVSEAKCEYEDANLIWRNTPSYSFHDVKAMAWYKGKGSLMATWLAEKGFVEYHPYIGRLMQIGETGIKIRTANRSDNGTYWLSLTLASVDDKLEAATHLEVKVPPSNRCKPRITREGSILKADLALEGCGTPNLTPKWKHINTTVIKELQNTSSLLDLGSNPKPGEYMACADGESVKCYQGNISDLCQRHTISQESLPRQNDLVAILLPLLLVAALVPTVVVIWLKRRSIRKTCCVHCSSGRKRTREDGKKAAIGEKSMRNEEIPLIDTVKSASIGLLDIQEYLRILYGSMKRVHVSPTGEGNFVDVSDVYIDLDFQQIESKDIKDTENDLASAAPDNTFIPGNECTIKTQKKHFSPIMIVGDSGSGKSTWCKHLVQRWSQNSKIKDANVQGLNLPDLGKFKILLYLTLRSSDRGLSFKELLGQSLFQQQPAYLEFLMNYMYDENHAQSILILIDGLDKIGENVKPILEVLDHKLLSLCTVVLTSRPNSLKLIFDTCIDISTQLELFQVCEMTLERSAAYIRKVGVSIASQYKKDFNAENFLSFTKYLHVQCLLKSPYLCLTLVFVWMKKKCFIEITDILLDIVEHFIRRAMTDERCKANIKEVLQEKFLDVQIRVNKLNGWPFLIKHRHLLCALSMIADDIFISETKQLVDEERMLHETEARKKDTLPLEVLYETGLVTESIVLNSKENLSNLTFTNVLLYDLFVSLAIIWKNGHAFDYIVSSEKVLKNSVIIHMVCQLSTAAGKAIFVNISQLKNGKRESPDVNNDSSEPNTKVRYSLTLTSANLMVASKTFVRHIFQDRWLKSVMYKGELDDEKLLFLTNYLRYVNFSFSLELQNNENFENVIFWLPLPTTLQQLTLDINNCTLQLCQEWNDVKTSKVTEIVIKSVRMKRSTIGLLARALVSCKDLARLEISPAVVMADDYDIFPERSDLTNYSWIQLSNSIQDMKKLKILRLNNVILVSDVDAFLSRLNRCENLETFELKNVSSTVNSQLTQSPGTSRGNNNDNEKPVHKTNLKQIELENLTLLNSPINFLLYIKKTNKTKLIKHNISKLSMLAVDMSEKSWETLGTQIGALTLSELSLNSVNPRGSVQPFLDGIGKCKELRSLSICKMDVGEISPDFSFLENMKNLSKLHLGRIQINGTSSMIFFKGIGRCKCLKSLSLSNIYIGDISESLRCVQNFTNLSEVTVDRVTITGGSGSLRDLLSAFSICKNLNTLSLIKINEADIPSARKGLKLIVDEVEVA